MQKPKSAMAGVAQCIEYQPVNQRIADSIPVRAHAWVAGQVPRRELAGGNHTLMFLFLVPFTSLLKINKIFSFFFKERHHCCRACVVPA